MPERALVKTVGFVEFSVDETDATDLIALLRTLGFRNTAQHKTKQVSVYSQSDIRLLVNTERAGFANASYAVHGPSAYAVTLVVDDAKQAVARAVALGAEPFSQPVGRG